MHHYYLHSGREKLAQGGDKLSEILNKEVAEARFASRNSAPQEFLASALLLYRSIEDPMSDTNTEVLPCFPQWIEPELGCHVDFKA